MACKLCIWLRLSQVRGVQWHEKTAYFAVTAMRWSFDKFTNYGPKMTEKKWMFRICFLETVRSNTGS